MNATKNRISVPASRVRPIRILTLSLCIVVSGLAYLSPSAAFGKQVADTGWSEFDRLVASAQASMMAHPENAMRAAQRAVAITARYQHSSRYPQSVATALWLEAEALTRTGRLVEARVAVTAASRFAGQDNRVTKLDGDLALSRARIAESGGDFASALKNYQQAHAIYSRLVIPRSQSLALLGLGDLYEKARDFEREIRYYGEAAQVYSGDRAIGLAAANNLGFAYQQMGRYRQSIPFLEKALGIATSLKSPILQANILDNLAISFARLQKLPEAERAADRSLALLRNEEESEDKRVAWGAKAEIAYRRGNLDAAVANLQQAFRGVNLTTTTPAFRDIHEIAYEVYRKKNDLALALFHHEAFKRLDDQGRSLAASANLALLGAKFDFARQDFEIEHLKSGKLERDIKLRKSEAELQAIVFTGTILAAFLLFGWIAWRNAILKRHRNAIEQKNIELVKALQAAQQASRAKSHFLANMSHELRTPLNAIIGFSELMHISHIKPENMRNYAGDILEGGRHLLAVLNNILDMARIESGKVELEERVVRLGDVVDYALSVLGGSNAHGGKELRTSGDRDVLATVDEVRLRQVVINLVSNALKFTGEGGLIEVRVERVEDGVDIVVQDNGEGIPADKIPGITDPFVQAESTYARTHGGSGLGLAIVKSLVELHGGRFTIESEQGVGTAARMHLPEERVVTQDTQTILMQAHQSVLSIAPAA